MNIKIEHSETTNVPKLDHTENHQEFDEPLERRLSEILADSHDNILPKKKLIIVLLGLSCALFMSFVDQTAITIALPYIADDLNAEETISWAGTSAMISSTMFAVMFGRFSDIFSRKYVLVGALLILGVSDLACGFAQTAAQLFVFRGFCGIGISGVTTLTMVILSDVVTLEDRGRYQGILGASTGLGNCVGPFISSALIKHLTWRKFYYMLSPCMLATTGVIIWIVPYSHPKVNVKEKLLQIDYLGFFASSVAIIFLSIPMSGGGSTFAWNSPLVISFFIIGGVFLALFIIVEAKVSKLPMVPMHLFTLTWSLTLLLSQNFLFGMAYYGLQYYLPYYVETIRGHSPTIASVFMLPMLTMQSTTSIISGQIISRIKHYIPVVWFGYSFFTLGVSLLAMWTVNSSTPKSVFPALFIGIGLGATLQPTLVAAQAQSYRKDRATVISTRNVMRSFGGATGLAVASSILSNSFIKELKKKGSEYFSQEEIQVISHKVFSSDLMKTMKPDEVKFLRKVYMHAYKNIIYFWIGCLAYCLITTLKVRDNGLEPLDEHQKRLERERLEKDSGAHDPAKSVEP